MFIMVLASVSQDAQEDSELDHIEVKVGKWYGFFHGKLYQPEQL